MHLSPRFCLCTTFIVFLLICTGMSVAGEQPNNPKPLPDDVVLPMPNGRTMVFRPVCIGEGQGAYAWKRFRVGDPSGGFKESPTGVALGGAFKVRQGETDESCYFSGK